ncbi:MAG: helix-turn-helix transcriptional regulator [Candidatus Binataceae bacterium]
MRAGKHVRPAKATPSSGNIFAGLDLPNPEQWLAKAELARRISDLIQQRGLSQRQAAALLGVKQLQVSAVMRGLLEGFTTDRLFRFLNKLGQEIRIVVQPAAKRKQRGSIKVEAA